MGMTKCLNQNGLRDVCSLCMPDFFSILFAIFLTAGFGRVLAVFCKNRWLVAGEKTGKCGNGVVFGVLDFRGPQVVEG